MPFIHFFNEYLLTTKELQQSMTILMTNDFDELSMKTSFSLSYTLCSWLCRANNYSIVFIIELMISLFKIFANRLQNILSDPSSLSITKCGNKLIHFNINDLLYFQIKRLILSSGIYRRDYLIIGYNRHTFQCSSTIIDDTKYTNYNIFICRLCQK